MDVMRRCREVFLFDWTGIPAYQVVLYESRIMLRTTVACVQGKSMRYVRVTRPVAAAACFSAGRQVFSYGPAPAYYG
jgi:hypothetical protein